MSPPWEEWNLGTISDRGDDHSGYFMLKQGKEGQQQQQVIL